MDLVDLIITIAILVGGSLLSGSIKFGKKTAPQQAVPTAKPEDEALADEDKAGDIWAEMFGEVIPEQQEPEVQEEGYFTYEDPAFAEKQSFVEEMTSQEKEEEDKPLAISEEKENGVSFGQKFDLRQAFIYQTLLERVNI